MAQTHWYQQHYLSSEEEAYNKFQFLSARFAPIGNGFTLTRMDISKLGINLSFAGSDGSSSLVSVAYVDIGYFEVRDFSSVDISANATALFRNPFLPAVHYAAPWCAVAVGKVKNGGIICVPTLQDAYDLIDALATLALAGGMDPMFNSGMALVAVSEKELRKHPEQSGMWVSSVDIDSPPAQAGIRAGDLLHTVGGKPCTNTAFWEAVGPAMRQAPSGGMVRMEVLRKGRLMPIDAHFPYLVVDPALVQRIRQSAPTQEQGNAPAAAQASPPAGFHLGIQVRPVIQDDVAALGLPSTKGLVVVSVENGGLADTTGILASDVILQLNGSEVGDMQQFVQTVRSGAARSFRVWRKGQTVELTVPMSM